MLAEQWLDRVHVGDCRELMRQMAADGVRVQCVITSPPYWGLRDYGVAGQFGLERTWVRHVARMRGVFRLVRELLAEDGVLWLNYGDSYANVGKWGGSTSGKHVRRLHGHNKLPRHRRDYSELKGKDLVGMPWRVALSLQADGWWLRSDVIWHKPNPMPESVTDRPTKAHEYLFLLTRSERYFYDLAATCEPSSPDSHARAARGRSSAHKWADGGPGDHTIAKEHSSAGRVFPPGVNPKCTKPVAGWADGPGSHSAKDFARDQAGLRDSTKFGRGTGWRTKQNESFSAAVIDLVAMRNVRTVWSIDQELSFMEWFEGQPGSAEWMRRFHEEQRHVQPDVWRIPTEPFTGAHFATFPRDLVRRCILAGSRPGDVVFDPFMGSGTVAEVATELGRRFIGCELNAAYAAMFDSHRSQQLGFGLAAPSASTDEDPGCVTQRLL